MCAEKKNQFYSFWVGVHVTVGKELMKDDRKTPNIRFVGKPGIIDGFWSVPGEHEDIFFVILRQQSIAIHSMKHFQIAYSPI